MGAWLILLTAVLGFQANPGLGTRIRTLDGEPLSNLRPGWNIVSIWAPEHAELVRAVRDHADNTDAEILPRIRATITAGPVPVLSVCEALNLNGRYNYQRVVIVGIFKSGMDETLRQDCPNQLVTGEVAWPNAIALTNPSEPPESLRAQIEKKKTELAAGYSAEAKPRSERVVGLYGVLLSPAGFANVACCLAVETSMAPARLFGLSEHDFRVIR